MRRSTFDSDRGIVTSGYVLLQSYCERRIRVNRNIGVFGRGQRFCTSVYCYATVYITTSERLGNGEKLGIASDCNDFTTCVRKNGRTQSRWTCCRRKIASADRIRLFDSPLKLCWCSLIDTGASNAYRKVVSARSGHIVSFC